jgi:hypothetical protein
MLANNSGGYSCSPGSPATSAATPANSTSANGPGWSCTKLGDAKQVLSSGLVDVYTPSHWVAFLDVVAIAAGLAGDSVTSSTRVVNGFDMNCVNLRASGVKGTSTICTTSQGVLGYVKVADDSTSFEIKSYSSTPTASLFQLPAGATVTTPQVTTATT